MARFFRRWWIWIFAVLVIGGAGVYYAIMSSAPVVSVVQPRLEPIESVIVEDGTVIPASKSVVAAMQGGRISELPVEVGDQVVEGDVIARLDSSDQALSIQALEARLASVRAEYDRARRGATKQELDAATARLEAAEAQVRAMEEEVQEARLRYNQGKLSANEYQRTVETKNAAVADAQAARAQLEQLQAGTDEETLRQLRAQVDETEAQLTRARLEASRLELVAPMDGTVLERPVQKGMVLAPGTTVAVIGDTQTLQVEAYVLASDSISVTPGQQVRITGDVLGHDTLRGTVKSVASVAVTRQSELGVLQERVRVVAQPDSSGQLKSGFGVDLQIIVESLESALTIPAEAVFCEDGANYVLVVETDTVQKRRIETGIRGEQRFQVSSGLTEADQVVLNPSQDLQEGDRVRIDSSR